MPIFKIINQQSNLCLQYILTESFHKVPFGEAKVIWKLSLCEAFPHHWLLHPNYWNTLIEVIVLEWAPSKLAAGSSPGYLHWFSPSCFLAWKRRTKRKYEGQKSSRLECHGNRGRHITQKGGQHLTCRPWVYGSCLPYASKLRCSFTAGLGSVVYATKVNFKKNKNTTQPNAGTSRGFRIGNTIWHCPRQIRSACRDLRGGPSTACIRNLDMISWHIPPVSYVWWMCKAFKAQ